MFISSDKNDVIQLDLLLETPKKEVEININVISIRNHNRAGILFFPIWSDQ